jgi:DNA-binding MarR family transcriptional regulator
MGKKADAKQRKRERTSREEGPNPRMPRREHAVADEALAPAVPSADATQIATQLNSVAIHLLRRLHREDAVLGLSGARLSALSVLVFGGARTIGRLAEAEGVTPPSMTRLVAAMETEGLVGRTPSPSDARAVIIRATPQGEEIMLRGREGRVIALTGWLSTLEPGDLRAVERATVLLEGILGDRAQGRGQPS